MTADRVSMSTSPLLSLRMSVNVLRREYYVSIGVLWTGFKREYEAEEFAQVVGRVVQLHNRTAVDLLRRRLSALCDVEHAVKDGGVLREKSAVNLEGNMRSDKDDVPVFEPELRVLRGGMGGRATRVSIVRADRVVSSAFPGMSFHVKRCTDKDGCILGVAPTRDEGAEQVAPAASLSMLKRVSIGADRGIASAGTDDSCLTDRIGFRHAEIHSNRCSHNIHRVIIPQLLFVMLVFAHPLRVAAQLLGAKVEQCPCLERELYHSCPDLYLVRICTEQTARGHGSYASPAEGRDDAPAIGA